MAEFALGLTKTAVEGTLSLVRSAVEEEAKLKEKVQSDLVFITGEFEMMQSFLRVANRERTENEVVLTWVRQLRYLAFDVEDCLEFIVHLDNKSRWGWLRRAWQTLRCRAPPLPLDVAVAEIKQLKARVMDVSQRQTRYIPIRDGNRPATIMRPVEEPEDATYASAFQILHDEWEATGKRRRDMGDLQELIAREDDDLHVISVWGSKGSGDLGAASILRKAYCDPKICRKFKSRAWVKLVHPFNHDEFVKSLATQFYASSHQEDAGVDFWTGIRAEDSLMQQMRKQRYLVVLEDVLAVAEWDVIRMYLRNSNNGSRIVVSTPELGIALLCAGEPYQVSEFSQLPQHHQFLCAFSRKTRSDMGEFNWQLRRRGGVISVWGADDDKSILFDRLYKGIMNRSKEFDGVEFEQHSWVDVPNPFDLKVFAQRLFLDFHSNDIRASEIIKAVGKMGRELDLIQRCSEFLSEEDCLVVINGLQSMSDWDLIKSKFLSKPTKGCILVITNDETVATHCVKDHQHRALHVKDLEADTAIVSLINKGSWHYGLGGINKGRLLYDRKKDALEWANKFKNVDYSGRMLRTGTVDGDPDAKVCSMLAVSGTAVVRAKAFLRNEYYGNGSRSRRNCNLTLSERRSWVVVPHPFNLMDFSWRLLLDFYSDDPQAKEAVAVGLMEGKDPIHECREFLREEEFLVVIDGLCSTQHWDLIKDTFLLEPIKCTIVVITNEKEVAMNCEHHLDKNDPRYYFQYEAKNKVPTVPDVVKEYNSLSLSKRRKKAIEWTEKVELVSRDMEGYHLTKLVLTHHVVSVWGIAGVGKSSLVMSVYYARMLQLEKEYRFNDIFSGSFGSSDELTSFGWVDVPHPFNLTEFSTRLLLDFHSDDPEAKEVAAISMMEGQDPILECSKFLCDEECLVVIDGLRSTQDWDLIRASFLSEHTKATIVVITNEAKVAMHCVENNEEQVLNIRRLEGDDNDRVLKKIAGEGNQLTHNEMELAQSIMAKCGGLPKVTAAVGEICSSDNTKVLESLSDNFMGTLETETRFHSLRSLFSWMQSYFDACSDSIKPCIFYLSIFSADKDIRRRRLLWRWIAEGYCRDTSSGTSEENGEKFVSELVNLSIIQQQSQSKVLCQINCFFHEYIISRPMEDNLVFALEGHCSLDSQRTGQHLTIRSNWDRDRTVFESIDFSRLRSLTVFGQWDPFFISNNINMRLLRVLDLEDAFGVTDVDLEPIGKLLPRLKFLSLRGCTEITCLPSSMGDLRHLQTLDIRYTSIVALPLVIRKLQKLQYIRAGKSEVWNWNEGDAALAGDEDRASSSAQATAATPIERGTHSTAMVLPPAAGTSVSCSRQHAWISSLLSKRSRAGIDIGGLEIGKLSVLHTFGVVNVNGSRGKSIFEELKKLTQLRKLGVSGINKGNIKNFCCAISGHAHLRSLSVELDKDDKLEGLDDIPKPPENLNSLKLSGHVSKLLVWIDQLVNLKRLKVDLTIVKPEELQDLRFSPASESRQYERPLHHLRIRPIQDGELQIGDFHARVVEIECSSVLHIKVRMNTFPTKIEVVKVHCSRGASFHFSHLGSLKMSLKEVWLKGYSDALRQSIQRQIDEMNQREHDGKAVCVLKLVPTCSS